MNKLIIYILLIGSIVFCESALNWDYNGPNSPKNWGNIKGYELCENGKKQSPINIKSSFKKDLNPLMFDYRYSPKTVIHNGHTILLKFSLKKQNILYVDDTKSILTEAHFHTPSEHKINGQHYPIEAQFIHKDPSRNVTIISVLFEVSDQEHPVMDTTFENLPQKKGESIDFDIAFDENTILPIEKSYFKYSGSLTSPPCSEDVNWLILNSIQPISTANLERLTAALGKRNARPLQKINSRKIHQFSPSN